ncbi:MAG: hypothetical protein CEN91_218 [Candidatus Berkelbacteria bacterium Licking1014_85]|uniref:SMODS and SLOG-associating 2TM effector domain-containing protein n=1 Tax=Candidatus Berkelbacteria bacterium Licking1014_85 TaxID=2017148 RepID=A0A554LL48_9BACT|nr:MAG: hypothetical protein CEN91_218 [Candidatus Berkelbacteria bacterium Licking1014_85]
MSDQDWDVFYESKGSRFFKLEQEILGTHGEDKKTLFYKIFDSTTKLIQVIGVVAGFGFTGLGYVEYRPLFIIGEFFLLVAIFIGLLWTQKIYRANLKNSNKEVNRVKDIFKERYSVFKKIYDKALSDIKEGKEKIEISASLMNELMEKDNDLMEKFISKEKKKEEWDPLFILIVLFVAGALGILTSFVNFEVFVKAIY